MSESSLYLLNKKSTAFLDEYWNGWGSSPVMWDYLGAKYIPEKPIYSLDPSYIQKVCYLHQASFVPKEEKICLMMTFDKAYIALADLAEASEACLKVGDDINGALVGRVNHWPEIGKSLAKINEMNFGRYNRFARGVVLDARSEIWVHPQKDWLTEAWSIFSEI